MHDYLIRLNAIHITALHVQYRLMRDCKAYYWEGAAKGTKEGEYAYEQFKHYRNQVTKLKQRLKRAHAVQAELHSKRHAEVLGVTL